MARRSLIFAYLLLYPLGQLPGIWLQQTWQLNFRLHITDFAIIALAALEIMYIVRRKTQMPSWLKSGVLFVSMGTISLFISPLFVSSNFNFTALLYAIRIFAYLSFAYTISRGIIRTSRLVDLLVVSTSIIAFLGVIQYILMPNLTSLKYLGWDDHFYRLVGTFLDPAFIGIILVLGIILSLWKRYLYVSGFMTLVLAFTYSRASWVALLLGLLVLASKKIYQKHTVVIAILLLLLIPFLPNPGGEGVNLKRVNSVEQKLVNYKESLSIIKVSPVFGVGLNNICDIKATMRLNSTHNSCSGLDNSFLFIVATTGVIGGILFLDFANKIYITTDTKHKILFCSSLMAILFHSFFTLTLFYPWVMGWLAILIGISRTKENKRQ